MGWFPPEKSLRTQLGVPHYAISLRSRAAEKNKLAVVLLGAGNTKQRSIKILANQTKSLGVLPVLEGVKGLEGPDHVLQLHACCVKTARMHRCRFRHLTVSKTVLI